MTREEKIKKAALVAVACFLEQEREDSICKESNNNIWAQTGKMMIMNKRTMVQRRGRLLKGA